MTPPFIYWKDQNGFLYLCLYLNDMIYPIIIDKNRNKIELILTAIDRDINRTRLKISDCTLKTIK